MDRDTFARHFDMASTRAVEVARHYLEESLPSNVLYRLPLDASYDANPLREGLVVVRQEPQYVVASRDEAIRLLWRDGLVPQWVDFCVADETGTATVVEALVCGRFTTRTDLLYHQREGYPPFHVTGPALPPPQHQTEEGERFSIHLRKECISLSDFERLGSCRQKVWSLRLVGSDFDDDTLAALPVLPLGEIIELEGTSIAGAGLAHLGRLERLNVLRIKGVTAETFTLEHLPSFPSARHLSLRGIPGATPGLGKVGERWPGVEDVRLHLRGSADVEPFCSLPQLRFLVIEASSIHGALRGTGLPRLSGVVLRLDEPVPDWMFVALGQLPALEYLSFETRAFDDAHLDRLDGLPLRRLRVVGCDTTREGRDRFRARNPGVELFPRDSVDPSKGGQGDTLSVG